MTRIIQPPRDQLNKLRRPMTEGEQRVFNFFDTYLHKDWEIYIEPHLNGLRPDIVLLHPRIGIAVFEVKDWNLASMNYEVEFGPSRTPRLVASKNGKKFLVPNPIEKVHQYKQEIYELYCPRLDRKSGLAAITAGVIFPFADDDELSKFLQPIYQHHVPAHLRNYYPLVGIKALSSKNLARVFPEARRSSSLYMSPELAKDLRHWLVEPDFASTQRVPLELDNNQKRLATTRTASGYRRIKGPAGSGKSMVVAARAAQLASEGKEVLVITYNITLLHLLMDIASRWEVRERKTRRNITWLNFHSWCKRTAQQAGSEEEYKDIWANYFESNDHSMSLVNSSDIHKEQVLNFEIPKFIENVIDNDIGLIPRYDAVIVDEGQDFLPIWWNILRKVCNKGGELIIAADTTQDVYGIANQWTEKAMTGAGFIGDWTKLSISYRMPSGLLEYTSKFAEKFLPKNLVETAAPKNDREQQNEMLLYPCALKWIQIEKDIALEACVKALLSLPLAADPSILAMSDITFLCDSMKFGKKIVNMIADKGVKSVHTFDLDSRENRKLKLGFFMGDARIKATTIHSFKGWETRALVIYISNAKSHTSLSAIYAGLTRLKRHVDGSFLTVICSAMELEDYGRSWPDFQRG